MTDKVLCGKSVIAIYNRGFLQRLQKKMNKVRPQLFKTGLFILHDNARPHIANVVTEKLLVYG